MPPTHSSTPGTTYIVITLIGSPILNGKGLQRPIYQRILATHLVETILKIGLDRLSHVTEMTGVTPPPIHVTGVTRPIPSPAHVTGVTGTIPPTTVTVEPQTPEPQKPAVPKVAITGKPETRILGRDLLTGLSTIADQIPGGVMCTLTENGT